MAIFGVFYFLIPYNLFESSYVLNANFKIENAMSSIMTLYDTNSYNTAVKVGEHWMPSNFKVIWYTELSVVKSKKCLLV